MYCCYLLLPNLHKFNLSRIIKPVSLSQIVQDFPCPHRSPANSPCDDRCRDPQTPPDPRPIRGGPNTNPHEVFDGFWKTTLRKNYLKMHDWKTISFPFGSFSSLFSGANILVLRECRDMKNPNQSTNVSFHPSSLRLRKIITRIGNSGEWRFTHRLPSFPKLIFVGQKCLTPQGDTPY